MTGQSHVMPSVACAGRGAPATTPETKDLRLIVAIAHSWPPRQRKNQRNRSDP
jgi:hypothetical protein